MSQRGGAFQRSGSNCVGRCEGEGNASIFKMRIGNDWTNGVPYGSTSFAADMTSSHDLMINYREYSGVVRTAGDDVLSIEGIEDILLRFPYDSGAFDIQLLNVAFVPQLSHNLLSLQQFTAAHHTYFSAKRNQAYTNKLLDYSIVVFLHRTPLLFFCIGTW